MNIDRIMIVTRSVMIMITNTMMVIMIIAITVMEIIILIMITPAAMMQTERRISNNK